MNVMSQGIGLSPTQLNSCLILEALHLLQVCLPFAEWRVNRRHPQIGSWYCHYWTFEANKLFRELLYRISKLCGAWQTFSLIIQWHPVGIPNVTQPFRLIRALELLLAATPINSCQGRQRWGSQLLLDQSDLFNPASALSTRGRQPFVSCVPTV